MSTFSEAVNGQLAYTDNGALTYKSSLNKVLDLFYAIGGSRGKDIIPAFVSAYVEDSELALRVVAWSRDIRHGAGERQIFKDVLKYLSASHPSDAKRLMSLVPELGRWDDLFFLEEEKALHLKFHTESVYTQILRMFSDALKAGNGLAAKWCPRKGIWASHIREYMGLSPKQYRKMLVSLTQVVEQQMCSSDWDKIDYNKVPSQASKRYQKAFSRHDSDRYSQYLRDVLEGNSGVKINAGAIHPHEVVSVIRDYRYRDENYDVPIDGDVINRVVAQWNALPNFVGDASILPMVDVSGSMLSGSSSVVPLDVAIGLGLYLSEKNRGKFKDMFLTFSSDPEMILLKGSVVERYVQMEDSNWGGATDINKALRLIIDVAVAGEVPQEEMPRMLLILSDMQFDSSAHGEDISYSTRSFEEAGYEVPKIVFWNLNHRGNVPVRASQGGVALVSGFSPSIMKSVLTMGDNSNPLDVMLDVIMSDRYRM